MISLIFLFVFSLSEDHAAGLNALTPPASSFIFELISFPSKEKKIVVVILHDTKYREI